MVLFRLSCKQSAMHAFGNQCVCLNGSFSSTPVQWPLDGTYNINLKQPGTGGITSHSDVRARL
jgi:hypothetical protein